jgi:hypothetical protein
MSLKDLLQSDVKVNHIKIKVIRKHNENLIVGDKSMLAICSAVNSSFKDLIEGKCYMILKPVKQDDNNFIPNEKLKPVKIADFPLTVKRTEEHRLVEIIKTNSCATSNLQADFKDNLKTFEDILKLPSKCEIKTVTVKVITISKNISGIYGDYNIGKFKDKTGEKMDMNLYSKQITEKLKRGEIVELRKVKLTEYLKDGDTFKRLSTTARTTAHRCSPQIENLFNNVPLGDEKEEGIVLAIHDIFPYISCSKCWRKRNDDDDTCQCGNKDGIKVNDFHCQFYIQMVKDEDVKIVHTFRRQTELAPDNQDTEEIQKQLDEKYVEKSYIFEWNINSDEDELRMVLITENSQMTS